MGIGISPVGKEFVPYQVTYICIRGYLALSRSRLGQYHATILATWSRVNLESSPNDEPISLPGGVSCTATRGKSTERKRLASERCSTTADRERAEGSITYPWVLKYLSTYPRVLK